VWNDLFYNKSIDELRELSVKDNKMGVFYMEYSYQQIGLSLEWFRNIANKINNKLVVRREILLQRLRGSSNSPYDRDDMDRIIELEKKPIETIMICKYYRLNIYEKLVRGIPYIVGIDCSTGTGGDNNAMSIINPYTTKLVAEFECSYVGEPEFIRCIVELVKKHIPRAILCIERNSVGDSVIAFLMESDIAGRVYFDKFKKLAEEKMDDLNTVESVLKKKAKEKSNYGVYTDVRSREVMFSILADRIKTHKEDFVGHNVTRDITKLVMKGTKIQAAVGFHDDSIMSYLIGMYVYYYGNNLEVFGFSKEDILYQQEERNTGMLRPEEIDYSALPESVIDTVRLEVERQSKPSYEDIYRETLMREQEKTRALHKKGLIDNAGLDNTLEPDKDAFFDFGSQNMDAFDELNGYDPGVVSGNNGDVFGVF
jgi:hypothetical protein